MITDFPTDRPEPPAWLTVPLSKLFGLGAAWYHRRYDGIEPYRPPVPVISVGNLVVGGTGKTPTTIALAKLLWNIRPELQEPDRIAVLSRGYGRVSRKLVVVKGDSGWEEAGDEPLLLKRALPSAAVVVHADRVKSAKHAVEKLGARILLLDDGFQHRRLARDLNIVLVDSEQPLGNGYLLPAGPLREPPANLRRATLLVAVGGQRSAAVHALAKSFDKPLFFATPQVRLPQGLAHGSTPKVMVLASIARPMRFSQMLKSNNIDVICEKFFPDHHHYSNTDLDAVARTAESAGVEAVLTTEKDQMRISSWLHAVPLAIAGLEMKWEDEAGMAGLLLKL